MPMPGDFEWPSPQDGRHEPRVHDARAEEPTRYKAFQEAFRARLRAGLQDVQTPDDTTPEAR